jgi:hypothetical protein
MQSLIMVPLTTTKELLMHSRTRALMKQSWQSEAYLSVFLFLLIIVGFVFPSIGLEVDNLPLYADIAFSIVLVVGTTIAWANRRLFVLASLVVIVAIVVRWVAWWVPSRTLALWSVSTGLVAMFTITAVLLWQVFRPGPVTVKRIQGALAAYLCIGAGWAHAYHVVALLNPGAFNSTGSDLSAVSTWVNYSFGMLTTVGYAGITPMRPLAHTLGSAEAITGQLYLAVLVARLVSMQASSTGKAGT